MNRKGHNRQEFGDDRSYGDSHSNSQASTAHPPMSKKGLMNISAAPSRRLMDSQEWIQPSEEGKPGQMSHGQIMRREIRDPSQHWLVEEAERRRMAEFGTTEGVHRQDIQRSAPVADPTVQYRAAQGDRNTDPRLSYPSYSHSPTPAMSTFRSPDSQPPELVRPHQAGSYIGPYGNVSDPSSSNPAGVSHLWGSQSERELQESHASSVSYPRPAPASTVYTQPPSTVSTHSTHTAQYADPSWHASRGPAPAEMHSSMEDVPAGMTRVQASMEGSGRVPPVPPKPPRLLEEEESHAEPVVSVSGMQRCSQCDEYLGEHAYNLCV